MAGIVTLTTDFGAGSCYVAAMKGVILSLHPQVTLIDLSHQIPPQTLSYTSFFLRASLPYFPRETLHVVVVDPGVGSQREILYVEWGDFRLLVPDNGCWTGLLGEGEPQRVIRLTESGYWRSPVSNTFHGRDIFAPVAGHLSYGIDPTLLGPETKEWVRLKLPEPTLTDFTLKGEIVFIDDFGNLITNIPGAAYLAWEGKPLQITVQGQVIPRRVRTYAEGNRGELVALVSSMDTLEIAVSGGSAAKVLQAEVGNPAQVVLVEEARKTNRN